MKVAIFIDGLTLYYSLENKDNINFKMFKEWLVNNDELVFAGYFNSIENFYTKKSFFGHVHNSGFKTFLNKPEHSDIETKKNVEILNNIIIEEAKFRLDSYDKIIIVSGKKLFIELANTLKSKGKIVEIVSFKKSLSLEFNDYSIRYIDDYIKYQFDNIR